MKKDKLTDNLSFNINYSSLQVVVIIRVPLSPLDFVSVPAEQLLWPFFVTTVDELFLIH